MKELRNALQGMTPPLVTPFDGDEIDWIGYESLLSHVIGGGVDALFPCGTTGEAASLTFEEKRGLVRRTVKLAPEDVPVFAGGTGTAIEETIVWIDEAASVGVDGIFLTAPFFHSANDPTGYLQFFEPIISESQVPFVLYNIPAFVGVSIPVEVVTQLASHENVIGIKDSSGDMGYGMSIVENTPEEFLVLQGIDDILVPSLRIGFDGGVNAGANVFPQRYASIADEPFSDASLSYHWGCIRPFFGMCEEHGFAPGTKAALVARDVIDRTDVRPPLVPTEVPIAAAVVN